MRVEGVPPKVTAIWPPLVLMALGAGYALWAQEYRATPRMMPTLTGIGVVILSVLDLLSRFDTRLGALLRLTLGADFRNREMKHDPRMAAEAAMVAWMVACVLLMLFVGILPAIPLFVAGYMAVWGRQTWLRSVLSAAVVLAFVVLVFEVLLETRLYRGVIFDPRGFESW